MKTSRRIITALVAVLIAISIVPPLAAQAATYTGTVNKDKVFFRQKPNTDSIYYAILKKGAKVTITGASGDFYKVEYDKKSGYIMKSLVNAPSAARQEFDKQDKPETVSKYAKAGSISGLGDSPRASRKGSAGDHVEKLQRAQQIKGFLKGTQFIVITHNRQTIGSADALYGVTMEKQGISKIVSVKFSDAAEPAKNPA